MTAFSRPPRPRATAPGHRHRSDWARAGGHRRRDRDCGKATVACGVIGVAARPGSTGNVTRPGRGGRKSSVGMSATFALIEGTTFLVWSVLSAVDIVLVYLFEPVVHIGGKVRGILS